MWIVAALVACQHADAPPPAAPKGPTACARASDSIVGAMLDRLPADATPPTEEADALRNLIRERCEHDEWSAEATRCLIAMKRLEDAEPCAKLMTEDQQAALVADQNARRAPPPPPGRPGPAGSGDQAGKPEQNGGSGEARDADQ